MAGLPAAQGAGGGDRARGAAAGDAKSDDGAHKAHPLQFEWVLWHDQPAQDKNTPWGGMLKQIATFSTVEEYWALFNNLVEPSRLPPGHTYSLFKSGIRPAWEDKQLQEGGEWRVPVPPSNRQYLDQYWVETVLTLIREGFEAPESDDIAGIVVNIRKGSNRIAIWTISALDEELQRTIGNRWREAAIQTTNPIEYFTFKSLKGTGGARKRSTYSV